MDVGNLTGFLWFTCFGLIVVVCYFAERALRAEAERDAALDQLDEADAEILGYKLMLDVDKELS